MSKTLEDMVKELLAISEGLSKGFVSFIVPTKSEKPRWCQCNKCAAWHPLAK